MLFKIIFDSIAKCVENLLLLISQSTSISRWELLSKENFYKAFKIYFSGKVSLYAQRNLKLFPNLVLTKYLSLTH